MDIPMNLPYLSNDDFNHLLNNGNLKEIYDKYYGIIYYFK